MPLQSHQQVMLHCSHAFYTSPLSISTSCYMLRDENARAIDRVYSIVVNIIMTRSTLMMLHAISNMSTLPRHRREPESVSSSQRANRHYDVNKIALVHGLRLVCKTLFLFPDQFDVQFFFPRNVSSVCFRVHLLRT